MRFSPPIFPAPGFRKEPEGTGVRPAASLYAVVKSPLAVSNRAASITEAAGPAAAGNLSGEKRDCLAFGRRSIGGSLLTQPPRDDQADRQNVGKHVETS